jgi:hypothetical protein
MLRNFHDILSFDAIHQERDGCSSWPTAASSWPAITALWMMCDALHEGLAAHREYEHLRSRGISHDSALRGALGLGCSQMTRETVKPLCFAGRA